MSAWVVPVAAGVEVLVLVQPRASRTRVVGEHDGRLKIALAAPPVDGEANAALVELIARRCGVRRADVEVVEGQSSRRKRVRILGADAGAVRRSLSDAG